MQIFFMCTTKTRQKVRFFHVAAQLFLGTQVKLHCSFQYEKCAYTPLRVRTVWSEYTQYYSFAYPPAEQRRINVDATSWRCIDVDATLYTRHVPAGPRFVWLASP